MLPLRISIGRARAGIRFRSAAGIQTRVTSRAQANRNALASNRYTCLKGNPRTKSLMTSRNARCLSRTAMALRVWLALFIAAAAFGDTDTPAKLITIDPHSTFQTFDGWGTSLCWWANIVGGFSQDTRDQLAQQIFTLDDNGLGFNIVRYNIGGGENPSIPNTMEPRARMEGFWPDPNQDFNWGADWTQRSVLADAIRHANAAGNPLRFEVFANSPPWWMTISKSATGRTGSNGKPAENLAPEHYSDFAMYLVRATQFLEQTYGIRIETISPFNEPTSDWWKYGGRQEGCYFTWGSMATVVDAFQTYLDGTAYQIAAPEDWSLAQSLNSWSSFGQDTRSHLSQINTHTYSGNQRTALFARADRDGRKLRVSEYGDGDASGVTLARTIVQDLKYLQASSWVNWQVVSPGDWGMIVNDHVREDYQRGTKFYVMAQFSRFLRPGFTIIGADDAGTLAAFDPVAGKVALVYSNFSTDPARITFNLSKFSGLGGTARWFQTEALKANGDQLAEKPAISIDDSGRFSAEVGAGSISTFLVDAAGPNSDDSFAGSGIFLLRNQATGLYMNINSDVPADRFTISGRTGSASQQFRFDAVADGYFRLVNRYSGHDVNVNRASKDPGAAIIQWWGVNVDQTAANSQWMLEPADNQGFRLRARNSGLYLDIGDAGLTQSLGGADTQVWILERAMPDVVVRSAQSKNP
jgi:O-glycosyl hydrolase